MTAPRRTPVDESGDRTVRIKESTLAELRRRASGAGPARASTTETAARPAPGRTITDADAARIADELIAKRGAQTGPTADELATMDPAQRRQHEAAYWSGRMGGQSPFWT